MYLQTITLDYEVQGALDGITLAPAFSPNEDSPAFVRPNTSNQVYPILVEGDLGLIDPDYSGGNASMGDRFLQRLEIQAATPGLATAYVAVADARGIIANVIELERVADIPGQTLYYLDTCVYLPQGSVLQISGFPQDPGGGSHLVRLHVVGADSVEGEALLQQMCCCEETARAAPPVCEPPELGGGVPASLTAGTGSQLVTLSGTGFLPADTASYTIFPDPTELVTSTVYVSPTQLDITIDTDLTSGGTGVLRVTRGSDPECFSEIDYTVGSE